MKNYFLILLVFPNLYADNFNSLIEMYPLVFEMCAEKGYNMTGRDHIIAFDTQRGV